VIPVYQDPAHPQGNCLQAAIASVLELPLEDVPDFANRNGEENPNWLVDICDWSLGRGIGFAHFDREQGLPILNNIYCIPYGKSPRSEESHAVVGLATSIRLEDGWEINIEYVHDPVGRPDWLDGKPLGYMIFTKQ
jgi:hypothetical protein